MATSRNQTPTGAPDASSILDRDMPATDPSAEPFRLAPRDFIARYFAISASQTSDGPKRPPAPRFLATGAVVFDRPLPTSGASSVTPHSAQSPLSPPRILLVQRAPHDSLPLTWEVPGGGCDDEDPSVLYACARELFEEAGLKAVSVGPLVRSPSAKVTRLGPGKPSTSVGGGGGSGSGGGDALEGSTAGEQVEQEEYPDWGEQMGGEFFISRSGKFVCKFQFVVAVERGQDGFFVANGVKLDPNEHVAYVWASEEEVRRKEVDIRTNSQGIVRADGTKSNETKLDFGTGARYDIVLEAFKLWK